MNAAVLGIDIGTSGTRALVVDAKGTVIAQGAAPQASSHPRPSYSEQNPAEWWAATKRAVSQALGRAAAAPEDIAAVGLSGQMHGLVLLDEADNVIRPAILWDDQRAAAECAEIEEGFGREKLLEIACNPALAGFTAPKIAWIQKHEPDSWARTRRILLPKDYIRLRLAGEYATDVADASGMLLLDVRKRDWSDEILSFLNVDRRLLPRLYESPDVTGAVTAEAAAATGLAEGTPVVAGAGDQAAAAVGNGIVTGGSVSATLGTSGVIFAATDAPLPDVPRGRVHAFCHAVPGMWHIMGVVLSAGGSLQWVRNELAEAERAEAQRRGVDVYDVLCEKALKIPPGAEGLIFLPYLAGERSPLNDPYARGAWIGLTVRHGKGHLVRAVVEGATFAMLESLNVVKELGGEVNEIRLSGGGATSRLWQSVQASVYNQPVSLLEVSEGSAYGAALLAMVGAGFYATVDHACAKVVRTTASVNPAPAAANVYNRTFPLYKQAYQQLKNEFKALGEVSGA
ncbi:MAG: xylulokinase [Planctomycetes bacterium]|nr:xylulokinase [Planctomycetota bacterium]